MAQYKVPQDVEADDKLIGPFSFRQFVYLLIAAGLIAITVGLFQVFPLLAIIPLPPILLLLALALPLKKDQPMETYLAALISFYLKPRKRVWTPGQRESTILITAPKIVEDVRKRDISQEEATHRLSFLADIVDTGGYAIKGAANNSMREDLIAEANATADMFDDYETQSISRAINEDRVSRREDVIRGMREAIERSEAVGALSAEPLRRSDGRPIEDDDEAWKYSDVIVKPELPPVEAQSELAKQPEPMRPVSRNIVDLANNAEFSVATIAKEANRINRKEDGEVFISLH